MNNSQINSFHHFSFILAIHTMVHPNRKTINERPAREERAPTPPLERIALPVPPGYKIPKKTAPAIERESYTPPPLEPNENRSSNSGHSSRNRDRSPARNHHRRRRRSSSSPRRTRRDSSLERYRHRSNDRRNLSIRSNEYGRQVQFAPAVELMQISPPRRHRHGSSPSRRRDHRRSPARNSRRHRSPPRVQSVITRRQPNRPLALADRVGPQLLQNPQVVQIAQERTPSVLKFENVPVEVDLLAFLTQLSRSIRSVVGATREFDYISQTIGPSIFIYICDQDEIDYAVMNPTTFNFDTGRLDIRPLLLSATITSIPVGDLSDPALKPIPALMIRHLVPIQVRHAIAAAIDVLQLVSHFNATITHIRVPGQTSELAKTAKVAFFGVSTAEKATELDGLDVERCGKKLPINKSVHMPVLIPTGLMKQQKDADWARRAYSTNMLILRPNPFA